MTKPQFLGSGQEWGADDLSALSSLSSPGLSGYKGLEGIKINSSKVTYTSDEVTALCPVTGQPDYYGVEITIFGDKGIESKSLKLYFVTLRNVGMFCEDLSRKIKDDVLECMQATRGGEYIHTDKIRVSVVQKARGGISIRAES